MGGMSGSRRSLVWKVSPGCLFWCPRHVPAQMLKQLTSETKASGCSGTTFVAGEVEVGGHGLYLWANELPIPEALS